MFNIPPISILVQIPFPIVQKIELPEGIDFQTSEEIRLRVRNDSWELMQVMQQAVMTTISKLNMNERIVEVHFDLVTVLPGGIVRNP